MNKRKLALIFVIALGLFLSSSNYQFQLTTVHAGDWEEVDHIDSMEGLNTGESQIIEGKLVSQSFALAASSTNFVDVTQTQTYGTTTNVPPNGMGADDATHSTLQEASFSSYGYPTVASYTGGSLPSGWYNYQWTFGSTYASIVGFDYSSGQFWTDQYDMSAYTGVRVKFDWKNDGFENTEYDELYCVSHETSDVTWFHSPAGRQNSYTTEQRDSGWDSTLWRVRWYATGLTGDVESWEGFDIDNIYLYGQTTDTYYRFEAVYRFDTVTHTYPTERLYIDYDAGTSQEGLSYYGGITTNPTDFIGGTSGAEPDTSFDVHDELTGTPFYVKIRDLSRTDGDQDSWLIDRLYLTVSNNAPTNDGTPTIAVLDDTDNLYSRYRKYEITTYHRDLDGYADIDYVVLAFDNVEEETQFFGSFDQDTHIFLEMGTTEQKSYWELDTAGSTYSENVNDFDVTWKFYVEWACPDIVNIILSCYVVDAAPESDTDDYATVWDIETDLEYDVTPTVTDDDAGEVDRGDLDEAFHITGDVSYQGSALTPPSGDVDVMVAMTAGGYGTNVGPWEDDTVDAGGTFDVTCYADDVVGIETYTVKVVKEGTGYGGTDLIGGADPTDDYIADEIEVYWGGTTDGRVDISESAIPWATFRLRLKYDNHLLNDGTNDAADINGSAAVWSSGSLFWRKAYGSSIVVSSDFLVTSASENTYGVTSFDSASATTYSQSIIWDAIGVSMWIDDGRDDIDDTITVYAWLTYLYDGTNVTDGTVLLNGTGMSYGSSIWSLGRSQSTVGLWSYNVTSVSGNTHGITVVGENIFDVDSITYVKFGTTVFDTPEFITLAAWVKWTVFPTSGLSTIVEKGNQASNDHFWLGLYFTTYYRLMWELGNGTTRNSVMHTWTPNLNQWYHIVGTYNTTSGWAHLYIDGTQMESKDFGFTVIGTNTYKLDVGIYRESSHKFDGAISSVRLYNRTLEDNEIFELYQCRYSDDAGLILHLEMSSWDVADGVWYDLSGNGNDGDIVSVVAGEMDGSLYARPIWDAIGVNMWISDGRDNIDDTITVYAWLTYLYDGTNVTDGTVLLNGTGMSYSSQIWSLGRSQSTVGLWAYNITSVSGNTYGITTIGNVYFDSINDWIDCGNLGNPAAGTIALWFLKYDTGVRYLLDGRGTGNWWFLTHYLSQDVNFNGLVSWNGMAINTWYHVVVTADASETKLYINGVLEDTGSALSIDFRSVRIATRYTNSGYFSGQMRDFRIYGRVIDSVEAYELYQGHYSDNTDLLLYYPTTSFDLDDSTWYDMSGNNNDGTVYSATANQIYSNVYIRPIWDEIEVYWSHVFDGRDNVGDQNYPCFSLRLKYDNHLLNDETNDDVSINGSVASWWSNYWYKLYTMETVGSWNFLVTSASENSYGITALDSASAVTYNIDIIWDRIVFTSNVNMTWTVIGYYINVSYTGTYEYDSTSWSGYATVANTSLTTGGAVHYEELTFATVANKTFYATVIEDAGGYDLTTFTTNTVWCVFDDVIAGSEGDMYWHKEVGYSRLIWGEVSTWKWQFNDSWIDNTYTLHAYSNSSTPEATGGIYGSGNFGGFVVGPYDVSWYYVNLTVNCEVTINGNAYDWEIWSLLMAVDIMHTIYIENFEIEPTDYYFWVAYQSNWNNATIMIWDALVNAGTSSADTILNGTLQTEGMYHWSRSTIVGTHNVSILINGSASALDEQNKDFSLDDAWWWYNFTYVIIAEDIEITTYTFFGATSDFDYMQYSGYINYDCTYNISEWSASWAKNETHTGSVSEGMFNIAWNKIGVNDVDANFTIVFVNGSLSLTINGFYGTAYKILRIDEIDVDNTEESQALTNITVNFYTNKDVDYYVYDRDDDDAVLVSGSSVEGSDYITWAKNVIPHAHYYAVKWTDGVTNIWYNASYWTFEENIDSLPKPQIDWDARDARRTIEFWTTVGTIATIIGVAAIGYSHYNLDKKFKALELPHYDTQDDEET